MSKARFRCRCCGELKPRRSAEQRYCGKKGCQQARKSAWRRRKYADDPDYRLNQARSTAAWLESQGGAAAYYREYRHRHRHQGGGAPTREKPAKGDRNRPSANRDANHEDSSIVSGQYRLVPVRGANRDAIFVQLSVIKKESGHLQISTQWSEQHPPAIQGP